MDNRELVMEMVISLAKRTKDDVLAITTGFEYTLVGIFATSIDLGLVS